MKTVAVPSSGRKQGFPKEAREELIRQYGPLIKYIAQRIASRLPPQIELDDLINAGVIGFIDAMDKFDPARQTQFRTYAEFRIRGAILDELRSLDWIPRSIRQKASTIEAAYQKVEQQLGRPAEDDEIASALGLSVKQFHELLYKVKGISLLNIGGPRKDAHGGDSYDWLKELSHGEDDTPYTHISRKELKAITARAIAELPEKERLVVTLYYYEELTMKEIGKVLGITESRVSQLHTKAILRLKGKLKAALG